MSTPTKEHAEFLQGVCDAMDHVRQAVPGDAKMLLAIVTADGEPVVLLTSANSNLEEMLEIINNRDESKMGFTRRSKLMGGNN